MRREISAATACGKSHETLQRSLRTADQLLHTPRTRRTRIRFPFLDLLVEQFELLLPWTCQGARSLHLLDSVCDEDGPSALDVSRRSYEESASKSLEEAKPRLDDNRPRLATLVQTSRRHKHCTSTLVLSSAAVEARSIVDVRILYFFSPFFSPARLSTSPMNSQDRSLSVQSGTVDFERCMQTAFPSSPSK